MVRLTSAACAGGFETVTRRAGGRTRRGAGRATCAEGDGWGKLLRLVLGIPNIYTHTMDQRFFSFKKVKLIFSYLTITRVILAM